MRSELAVIYRRIHLIVVTQKTVGWYALNCFKHSKDVSKTLKIEHLTVSHALRF